MAFCSNSGFGRLLDSDIIYSGPSITCGNTTVNPGDSFSQFIHVLYLCTDILGEVTENNELVIPDTSNRKIILVGPGTYTQPGGPDVVVPSGHMGILNWDGSEWYLGSSVEMPEQVVDGKIEVDNERAVSGDAVFKYALNKRSGRALPNNRGFIPFDRPDIKLDKYSRHVLHMDGGGYTFIYPDPSKIVLSDSSKLVPDGVEFITNDRPDLNIPHVVVVDDNNYYVPLDKKRDVGRNVTYQDFGVMEGYEVESVKDLEAYYSKWEGMIGVDSSYVSRTSLRSSGKGNLPIWRYDFKPKNPRVKIFMIGLSHGWEKNISFGLVRFMEQLVGDWRGNNALTYIRQNVHFIVIPCVSPDNFVNSLFNGSPIIRMRNNYETDFIQASFTAIGTDINISFSENNFPNSEFFTYTNYFLERKSDIEGMIGVTVIDSTDTGAVKHNEVYRLKKVNSVGDITLTNDKSVSGSVSGTLKFAVLADPERNYDASGWGSFVSGTAYGNPRTYYDNKGTKPFSLKETNNVKDVLDSNLDLDSFINWHSGAGDYFTYFNNSSFGGEDTTLVNLKSMFESLFNVDVLNTTNSNPTCRVYFAEQLNLLSSTPEWHSSEPAGTGNMTTEQATELHNWIGNFIYMSSYILVNNKR